MKNYLILKCPYCGQENVIFENDKASKFYRCGIYKYNCLQIPFDKPPYFYEELVRQNLIFGCTKIFLLQDDKAITCNFYWDHK